MSIDDRSRIEQLLLEILGGHFDQVTEKASKIIDVLDLAPEQDRVPLLAFVLGVSHLASESDFIERGRKMSNKRFDELKDAIFEDFNKVLHVWVRRNPTEEELAGKVWAYI